MIYSSWNIKQNRLKLIILGHFFPFYPPKNKKSKFKKNEKAHGNIISLHMWTINDNHDAWFLRYGARQTEMLIILHQFLSFYFHIKILRKWKKHLETLRFYTNVPKIIVICYTVPEIRCERDTIFMFHRAIFCPSTPLASQKITILKN